RDFLKTRLSDPVWMASNLWIDAMLHCQLRDSRSVQKRAEELLAIANEHGMSFHTTQAAFLRGWALVDQGRAQEGIAEMLQNISTDRAVQITPNYAVLAESLGKNARPEEGLAGVAEALKEAERSGERILLPRLYGIQGELILVLKPS